MKPILKGNLAMTFSKICSGLNENALKYMLPKWMSAYTGVFLRLGFGSLFFWIYSLFTLKNSTHIGAKDILRLLMLGAFIMFGYMFCLLMGLTYTTPISSSLFISMEPVWVFVICAIFMGEKVTWKKIVGIIMGLCGALLCILTQKSSDVASNAMLGNLFCIASSLLYSLYLIWSKKLLKRIDKITVTKWTFTGGLISALIMLCFTDWYAPVLHCSLFSTPMLVLLFILIFTTSIDYLLVAIGLKYISPTVVALYGYVILIVAMIASYILGQDHFEWWQIPSVVLIIGSVYCVELAERKEKGVINSVENSVHNA